MDVQSGQGDAPTQLPLKVAPGTVPSPGDVSHNQGVALVVLEPLHVFPHSMRLPV